MALRRPNAHQLEEHHVAGAPLTSSFKWIAGSDRLLLQCTSTLQTRCCPNQRPRHDRPAVIQPCRRCQRPTVIPSRRRRHWVQRHARVKGSRRGGDRQHERVLTASKGLTANRQLSSLEDRSVAASRHAVGGDAENEGQGQGTAQRPRHRHQLSVPAHELAVSVPGASAACPDLLAVTMLSITCGALRLGVRGSVISRVLAMQEPHDLFRDKVFDYKGVRGYSSQSPFPLLCAWLLNYVASVPPTFPDKRLTVICSGTSTSRGDGISQTGWSASKWWAGTVLVVALNLALVSGNVLVYLS